MSFPHFAHPSVRIATAGYQPSGTINVTSLTDVNALLFALGGANGNTLVAGFYDRRLNVSLSTLNVTAWADCRTTGAGPTANYFGSGTNPTVTVAGSPITFTAGGATLGTTNVGAFALGGPNPLTVVFVGSAPAATTANLGGIVNGQPAELLVATTSGGGGLWKGAFGNSGTSQITSGVATTNATVRVVISDLDTTGANARFTVPNQATGTLGSITTTHNFTSFLFLGASSNGAAVAAACTMSAVIVLNVLLTTGQISSILNWAVTNHSAVAA